MSKIRQIVRIFSVDLDATRIAAITRLNRNTINRYLAAVRDPIARYCEAESPVSDEVVDESYFVAHRAKGIPRRRERGKAIVFGLSSVMVACTSRQYLIVQSPRFRG